MDLAAGKEYSTIDSTRTTSPRALAHPSSNELGVFYQSAGPNLLVLRGGRKDRQFGREEPMNVQLIAHSPYYSSYPTSQSI